MKKKSKLMMFIVFALVAMVSVGATWALSMALTEQKTNNFMVKNPYSFVAKLYEPLFTDDALQQANAMQMAPGSKIAKNPYIQNESEDGTEGWAAMRIIVTVNDVKANAAQMDIINKVFSANWETTNWLAASGTAQNTFNADGVYYYNKIIVPLDKMNPADQPAARTTPIFTEVSVKSTATKDQLRDASLLGRIDIKIVGMTLDKQYGATLDTTVMNYLKTELDGYTFV